jgi:hypothetical protein
MSDLVSLTGSTCGEACWTAREDICRCSCGGRNHGIWREGQNGVRPPRTSKIDGFFYRLAGVGIRDIHKQAREINNAAGYRSVVKVNEQLTYHYSWQDTDKGAPARVKPVSKSQRNWTELDPFEQDRYVYLLWIRDDALDPRK